MAPAVTGEITGESKTRLRRIRTHDDVVEIAVEERPFRAASSVKYLKYEGHGVGRALFWSCAYAKGYEHPLVLPQLMHR